jgi:[ribosomal protein S5]-alanine N-acetyltransferase
VRVAVVGEPDLAPYRRAVEQSRQRLVRWNPVDPEDLGRHLRRQSRSHRTFLIHAQVPEGDHDLVGKVNVTDAVRGRLESAAIGYDAYDPYAGRGLFAEGLRLVLDLAFAPEPEGGMGLHRVVAGVQPGNQRSAGLLRSLGFRREGFSPRMLWLPGADGKDAWQDHVSYAVLRDDWPAQPYPPSRDPRVVVLVNGAPGTIDQVPGSGSTALARRLAAELGIPLFSREVVGSDEALWALLADSPSGGVVEGCFRPDEAQVVMAGLRCSGLDPSRVCEVWCSPAHVTAPVRPLALGPTVLADLGQDPGPCDIVRIALQVGGDPHS